MSVELREVSASSSMANVKVNDKAVLASTALAVKLPSPRKPNRRPGPNKLQTRSRAHLCGRTSQISI